MSAPFYLLNKDSLVLHHDGQHISVASDHVNWAKILLAIKEERWDDAIEAGNVTNDIAKRVIASGVGDKLTLENGIISFNGVEQGPHATKFILDMVEESQDLQPVVHFLERLSHNTSCHSIEMALEFVVRNGMPLAQDGRFMAYKRIKDDWTDCCTGSIDNSVGAKVSMPRHEVDDDPAKTCSSGLHACAKEYLRSFVGDRLIAIAIDPKDVVCVPHDYNNTKMRVCAYEVVDELNPEIVYGDSSAWTKLVVDENYNDVAGEEGEEDEIADIFYVVSDEEPEPPYTPSHEYATLYAAKADMEPGEQIWLCARNRADETVDTVVRVA